MVRGFEEISVNGEEQRWEGRSKRTEIGSQNPEKFFRY